MRVEILGEGEPGVAVVGGIHGDEPCGVAAVERLIEERPAVNRPVRLVVANEEAVAAERRYLERDLNRSFPGNPDSDAHEVRLAYDLAAFLADCTTLAMHSTQSYEGMFALVDEVDDLARRVCPRLSIDAVVETGPAEGRIFAAAPDTIEVECGYQGSERARENAVQVSREFLAATGVLPDEAAGNGDSPPRQDSLPVFRLGDPIYKPEADEYEVYAENFTEVAAGETFAVADGEPLVADESFYPVLLSAYGYEDVFGYRAERVGTLEA